jgi:DNA polymerase III subunit epsilon
MEQKNIVIFDLETTGTDIRNDRVIQIAARKVSPDLKTVIEDKGPIYVNPECDIPAEATAVHGITNEMVAKSNTFRQMAKAIYTWFDGCDLAGFRVKKFDVPFLAEEFHRAGIKWPALSVRIIDAWEVYISKEPRDLASAVKFYTGKDHEAAHTADGDVSGTHAVLAAQVGFYESLPDVDAMHKLCAGDLPAVDPAGMIVLKDGVPIFNFGKHMGKPVRNEPGYVAWMRGQSYPRATMDVVEGILKTQ